MRAFCAFKKKKKRGGESNNTIIIIMSSSFSSSSHSSSRNQQQQQQQQQQRAMPFQLFLEKMRQPLAAELVSGIKHFINTFVLEEDEEKEGEGEGEEGGGKKKSKQRDSAKDSEKIQRFLRAYEEKFRRHSLWRNCSPEKLRCVHFLLFIVIDNTLNTKTTLFLQQASTEGLEKYVCTKLYSTIFDAYGEEDDAINDATKRGRHAKSTGHAWKC